MYRILALALPALALLAVVFASGCKQTRPIPAYQPLLALEAATAKPASIMEMYRPSWSGPKPQPKRGGG
ncbi:MAG: hypothetical protein JRG91_18720 [Deltaproteobacteria bacterium]|nr:hypothetical protein [Deltaproteobacteria bacterium]